MTSQTKSIAFPVICVSDIHLQHSGDSRALRLIDLLNQIDETAVEYLILNGDIFDFCFGDSDYFRKKFNLIGNILKKIAKGKTRVLYLQGNHEFSISSLLWDSIEFCEQNSVKILLESGTKIAICHGDRLCAPWHYHLYANFVHSKLFKSIAKIIPMEFLDKLSLKFSKLSRASDENRTIDHNRIIDSAFQWLNQTDCNYGIIGHFHFPYAVFRNEKAILSVESWDAPNCLVFDGNKFMRILLRDENSNAETTDIMSSSLKL